MRGPLPILALVLVGACYQPVIPEGVPCSQAGECPGGTVCVAGVCRDQDADPDLPPGTTVITVGADRAQVRDTEVSRPYPSDSYGDQDHFSVDDGETGLLAFDLSGVPAGIPIAKATLHVVTTDEASLDGGTVLLYRVLERWDEGAASWLMRTADKAWTTTGAKPPSREDTPIAELRPNQKLTPFDVSIPAQVVEGWLTDPATNFGIAFVRGTSTQHVHIASRETGLWSTLTLELRP